MTRAEEALRKARAEEALRKARASQAALRELDRGVADVITELERVRNGSPVAALEVAARRLAPARRVAEALLRETQEFVDLTVAGV